jgi:steroid delta-isomerase-like uncharacterized protein
MSLRENKELARRLFDEVWSGGRLELATELLVPDFVGRPGGLGAAFHGHSGAQEFIGGLRRAFPDLTFEVEDLIGERDLVAARWTARGTNHGAFMGMPPTGRRIALDGMTIQRIQEGRIVEGWIQPDAMSLVRQIAVSEPDQA